MTLLEWGALGELIGGIAIIASLIYVGRQLKQTNSMSRSAVRQELSSEANYWAMSIAAEPSLAEAIAKVHFHGLERENATDQERIQIGYALLGLVGQIFLAYEQWKEGILTDKELDELNGPRIEILSNPYLASVWPKLRAGYPKDFNDWFERRYGLSNSDVREFSSG